MTCPGVVEVNCDVDTANTNVAMPLLYATVQRDKTVFNFVLHTSLITHDGHGIKAMLQ